MSITRSNIIFVADAADRRLDDFRDIRERDAGGEQSRPGFFIGEQLLIVEKMLRIAGLTRSVLTLPAHVDRLGAIAEPDVRIYVVERCVMEEVAGFNVHRGVLAVGHRPPREQLTLDTAIPRGTARLSVLLCEDVNNMDNVGMLFRNAAAFGVDAVVLSPACHDPLYRKSLRVSIGHALTMPWAQSSAWSDDLLRLKQDWGLTLIGAALDDRAVPLDSLEPPSRLGLIVGQEFRGLSETTLNLCDSVVKIPMAGDVDSLNVATAAAVCLHRLSTGQRS